MTILDLLSHIAIRQYGFDQSKIFQDSEGIPIEIEEFGKIHVRKLYLLGKKDKYLSLPIVIPKKLEQGELILGEGTYSLDINVKSIDGKVLLAQLSDQIAVYE